MNECAPQTTDPHRKDILRILFLSFFRISGLTIGGGLSMIPLIQREFVDKYRLIDESDFLDMTAVVQSMPGIIAINFASFLGYRLGRLPGLLFAAFGVAIPPFLAIVLLASLFLSIRHNAYVQSAFLGVRAAITALILAAGIRIAKKTLTNAFAVVIVVLAWGTLTFFPGFNVFCIIALAGTAGMVWSWVSELKRRLPEKRRSS